MIERRGEGAGPDDVGERGAAHQVVGALLEGVDGGLGAGAEAEIKVRAANVLHEVDRGHQVARTDDVGEAAAENVVRRPGDGLGESVTSCLGGSTQAEVELLAPQLMGGRSPRTDAGSAQRVMGDAANAGVEDVGQRAAGHRRPDPLGDGVGHGGAIELFVVVGCGRGVAAVGVLVHKLFLLRAPRTVRGSHLEGVSTAHNDTFVTQITQAVVRAGREPIPTSGGSGACSPLSQSPRRAARVATPLPRVAGCRRVDEAFAHRAAPMPRP